MAPNRSQYAKVATLRYSLVLGILVLGAVFLVGRAVQLQVLQQEFLQGEGDARALRVVPIPAHRGMITDRFGEPLAVSAPVDSVWADPGELSRAPESLPALAQVLGTGAARLQHLVTARKDKEFVYLARRVPPELARRVMELRLPGVALQREYRRYYPSGEVTGQLLGFTDIDDAGQEGLERSYDDYLRGTPGAQRVLKDRLGRTVETVEHLRDPRHGGELQLSIDRRIQYLAYRALQETVRSHGAEAGTVVVLDVKSGEVLAMVNQPAFNPNGKARDAKRYRNRAVTDTFEPGSTMKPFTIACALESGSYRPDTPIDTRPGWWRVGRKTIRDVHNYGLIDVSDVIQKSSNVGASRIALSLSAQQLWSVFSRVGFGLSTHSGFPGEVDGYLAPPDHWREIEQATLSYGYGLSVTALQLARAYAVLASGGVARPVTFLATSKPVPGERVLGAKPTAEVLRMMERVVQPEGTAVKAQVPGYRVAGKTGTVRKAGVGGYIERRYRALFVGTAPASQPRLVMAVVIDEPTKNGFYGGQVAAPLFSTVMAGALRLMDVAPDDLPSLGHQLVASSDEAH